MINCLKITVFHVNFIDLINITMKNLFRTSIYLLAFVFAGILFQISCSNSDDATIQNNSITEKFVFVKKDFPGTGEQSIWISDLDGSNQAQIPISLPSDLTFYNIYSSGEHTTTKLSQDGSKVLFTVQKIASRETYIYSCDIDGSNLQELVSSGSDTGIFL